MAKHCRSSIPPEAVERTVSPYRREGSEASCRIWYRRAECILDGAVVGERQYDEDGTLAIEKPLRNGKLHGVVYHWHEGGTALESAEPYRNGLPHGTARQWDWDGTLLGTYTLNRGTGLDLWRARNHDPPGPIFVAEVHSMEGGRPHGFEWWLNEDQKSVYIERHWHEGGVHGIEREWNSRGRLCRGYPKYFIRGEPVNKRAYLRAARADSSLPPFRVSDNEPQRTFPTQVAAELAL